MSLRLHPKEVVRKFEGNPIITAKDVPYKAHLAYNPTAIKVEDQYLLIFRIDIRLGLHWKDWDFFLGIARSRDGFRFTVDPQPLCLPHPDENRRMYDPRITRLEDRYYITYTTESYDKGIQGNIMATKDFKTFQRIYQSEPDQRNMVIFPEKINGLYCRLDRPFGYQYEPDRPFDIWISYSPDMEFWGRHKLVMSAQTDNPWGVGKIGPGTPPVKTREGWLVIYHAVVENGMLLPEGVKEGWGGAWTTDYKAGVMLLDLDDPSKIIGICKEPILEPEEHIKAENEGLRARVLFPGGMIEEPDGTVKIYYGISDSYIGVATAKMNDLVELCLDNKV